MDAVERTAGWLTAVPIPEPRAAGDQAPQLPGMAPVEELAIVEVFGHRRLAGRIFEVERFGAKMLRVDVPTRGLFEMGYVTHYFGGGSIFSLTPCDAETVRRENGRVLEIGISHSSSHSSDDDENGWT